MVRCTTVKKSCTAKIFIYSLTCPLDNRVKYVGKTTMPLNIRLSQHLTKISGNDEKRKWIETLKLKGIKPKINLLETLNHASNWNKAEQYWIHHFGIENLVNDNKGGAGGRTQQSPVYIKKFEEFLETKYSSNSIKNYISVVKKFLSKFNTDRPRNINSEQIVDYLSRFTNNNRRNSTICALKLFYSEIVEQPKKFRSIKYMYHGHCTS